MEMAKYAMYSIIFIKFPTLGLGFFSELPKTPAYLWVNFNKILDFNKCVKKLIKWTG